MGGKTWNREWINRGPTEWGGARLDKDIRHINKNYINYIQSNPKLVLTMDDLAVADMGTTGHYLNLDLPWSNKQKSVHPLPIQMPNGEVIKSTHTSLLSNPDLTLKVRQAHLFPGLTKALLSIGTFCEHGCESTFNDKSIHIKNNQSGNIIMRVTRDACTNLYMLGLTQQKKLIMESTTPDKYFSWSAYECKSKSILVDYHHTSWWSPTHYGWGKAITKKLLYFFDRPMIGPGTQTPNGNKSAILGHLQQPLKGLRST